MKPLTLDQARHITARTFAQIVASVARAAEAAHPVGQRDRTRRGNPAGDAMMERRAARRAKALRQTLAL